MRLLCFYKHDTTKGLYVFDVFWRSVAEHIHHFVFPVVYTCGVPPFPINEDCFMNNSAS